VGCEEAEMKMQFDGENESLIVEFMWNDILVK
jgi:hypothetical protein